MNTPSASGRAQTNWRRSTGSPPVQMRDQNQHAADLRALNQLNQDQMLQQQQQLYQYQQAQMELQLMTLKMQNLEMQGRLLAASSGQQAPALPAQADRRSVLMSGFNQPVSAPASPSYTQTDFTSAEEVQGVRRGALQHLQRAQQQRSNSAESDETGEIRMPKRGNRLSFVGGEGLAEHALARKRSGAFSPALVESPPVVRPGSAQTHHRKTSSNSSSGSYFKAGDKLMSPPGGPTLVLSEPGDKYPSPTLSRNPGPRTSRPLPVNTKDAQQSAQPIQVESDTSSPHSSDTDSNSEVASFESVTTVASEPMKPTVNIKRAVSESAATMKNPSLNPAASAFTPGNFLPSEPPSANEARRNKRDSASSLGLNYPSTFNHSPGFRNFTAPPALNHGAIAVRQPKGPAKEDELAAKNFNGRMRKQALTTLNRRSFVPPPALNEAAKA